MRNEEEQRREGREGLTDKSVAVAVDFLEEIAELAHLQHGHREGDREHRGIAHACVVGAREVAVRRFDQCLCPRGRDDRGGVHVPLLHRLRRQAERRRGDGRTESSRRCGGGGGPRHLWRLCGAGGAIGGGEVAAQPGVAQEVLGEGALLVVGLQTGLDEVDRLSTHVLEWLVVEMVTAHEDAGDHGALGAVVVQGRQDLLQIRLGARPARCIADRGQRSLWDGLVDFYSLERSTTRQEDVRDHSEAPHVAALVVRLAEDLGGSRVGGADDFLERCATQESNGITKVDDLDLGLLRVVLEENVLQLDVSVADAVLVAVHDRPHDLQDICSRLQFR